MEVELELNNCQDCGHYRYVRCYGIDCHHPKRPNEMNRGEELLAENRIGDFPLWCSYIKKEK